MEYHVKLTNVITLRGRAVAARRAHNPEVAGSNPAPAISKLRPISGGAFSANGQPLLSNFFVEHANTGMFVCRVRQIISVVRHIKLVFIELYTSGFSGLINHCDRVKCTEYNGD